MAGPYDRFSDEELERIARGQVSAPQNMPSVIPLPQTPSQQRQEQRESRGEQRDDTRLGLTIEGEGRAQRGEQRDTTKQAFDFESELRAKFNALPAVSDYQTVVRQLSTALKTKPTPTGDQALITAYAKMLDPGSVVREQEFNVVAAGDSTLGKSVARLQKELGVDGGGMLRPEVRQRVREEMLNLTQGYNKSYNQARVEYRGIADSYGLAPERVIGQHLATPYAESVRQWGRENSENAPIAAQAMSGFADPDDDRKSIPIPAQMQAEYQAGLRNVRTADDFATLRDQLDRKYGFAPNTPEQMQANRDYWSQAQGRPGQNIPPADAAMQVQDRLNNSLFNNPVGAGIMAAPIAAPFMDEIAGGVRSAINGTSYQVERDIADATKQNLQTQFPLSSITGALVGGGVGGGMLAKAAPRVANALGGSTGRLLGSGAGFGAISGAGELNSDRATGALYGAGAGAGGAAAGRAVAPLLENITSTRPVQTLARYGNEAANAARGTLGRPQVPFQQAPRLSRTDNAVSTVPIGDIRQNVSDAQSLGLPYTLADATPQTRALAGSAARFSPNVRQQADKLLKERQAERPERAMEAVRKYMGDPVDLAARKDYWTQAAKQQASPLYDEAFQGGSVAPLESQLTNAFNQSSQAVADAKRLLAEAQRGATLSSAAVQRSGDNVYQNAKTLPQNRESGAAIAAASKRVEEAEAQHSLILGRLREAQGDAASNAPGAVWNPRLQQFIDDPLSKIGLKKGLEVQRLEALARNERFDPTEYAITGTDARGNPVVGNVPNMRTLDAIKRGYDEILNGYPVDVRGNPVFDERGRAITMAKQALVGELDSINPTYGAARDSYGTYAKNREALDWGYNAPSRNVLPRDMQASMGEMNPSQLNEARTAYATRVIDDIAKTERGNPLELFMGTPGSTTSQRRAKVGMLFPDAQGPLDRMGRLEGDMTSTYQEVLGGSPTQPRRVADEQFASRGGDVATSAMIDMATASPGVATGMTAIRGALRNFADARNLGGINAQRKADEIGPTLLGQDSVSVMRYLDELERRQREVALRQAQFNRTGGLIGGMGGGTAGGVAY